MLNLSLLIAVFSLSFAYAGKDLVYSNTKATYKAVVQLGSNGRYCTGTMVGLNPPTVITARHCVAGDAIQIGWNRPSKVIESEYANEEFNLYHAAVPGDLAVLIFEDSTHDQFSQFVSEKDLFTVSPEIVLTNYQEASVCGNGYSSPIVPGYEGLGTQRCGTNNLIMADPSINFTKEIDKLIEKNPGITFSELSDSMKVKYIHHNIQTYLNRFGSKDRFGFGALLLNPEKPKDLGKFDEKGTKSLVNQGDSGGPLFIAKEEGNVLIGVTSLVLSNWNIFGSIFWSINSPWSQKLLERAIDEGADIRGLMKKAKLKFKTQPKIISRQGNQGELRLELLNKSDVPTGPIQIKINKISSNLTLNQTEATIPQIDPRFSVSQFISTYKIKDSAELGSPIVLKGKISYDDQVEEFTIQDVVRPNPSADVRVSYSASPKVNALFDPSITVSITPKYDVVSKYDIEATVLDDQGVRFKEISAPGEAPRKGKTLKYKIPVVLNYGHRGQTIRIKIAVSNGNEGIYQEIVELRPH